MVNLFFPLAFLLLSGSIGSVVLALFLLDEERGLKLWTQRVLGAWFGLFGAVLAGILTFQLVQQLTTKEMAVTFAPNLPLAINLLVWEAAFAVLSIDSAYYFLFVWCSEAEVSTAGVVRKLAFGSETIGFEEIDKVVEVAYLYAIQRNTGELRTRSFFVLVRRKPNRLLRYTFFRPANYWIEDQFRDSIERQVPLIAVTLPGLPRLPRISFYESGTTFANGDLEVDGEMHPARLLRPVLNLHKLRSTWRRDGLEHGDIDVSPIGEIKEQPSSKPDEADCSTDFARRDD